MIEARFELVLPSTAVYSVQGQYRWPYSTGVRHVGRVLATPYGRTYPQWYGKTQRLRKLRFVEADRLIEPFTTLGILAERFAREVTFYPDYTNFPASSWAIAWEPEFAVTRVLDNRLELEVTVPESV